MKQITSSKGINASYFPAEILLKQPLKIRGKITKANVIDAIRRVEAKESTAGKTAQPADKEGAAEKKQAAVTDGDDMEGDDDNDGDF
eukprot:4344404-Amphidinium_carterae.1